MRTSGDDACISLVAARTDGARSAFPAATGIAVGLAGIGCVGVGLWGRREVRRALTQERIVAGPDAGGPRGLAVTGASARSMAEFIRRNTLEATGGRIYVDTDPYVDAEGKPTSDATRAAKDERTGAPLENPDHDLWIQSTTLQTALMQAYMGFRLSELTIALGVSLAVAGLGLVAMAHQTSP
jgi:hypothetical protein